MGLHKFTIALEESSGLDRKMESDVGGYGEREVGGRYY